jgi:hypothetical protein
MDIDGYNFAALHNAKYSRCGETLIARVGGGSAGLGSKVEILNRFRKIRDTLEWAADGQSGDHQRE